MLFIVLFTVAMLFVPIAHDVQRHGRDNILRRSGEEILDLRLVAAFLDRLGRIKRGVNALVATVVAFIVLLIAAFLAWKVLVILIRAMFAD